MKPLFHSCGLFSSDFVSQFFYNLFEIVLIHCSLQKSTLHAKENSHPGLGFELALSCFLHRWCRCCFPMLLFWKIRVSSHVIAAAKKNWVSFNVLQNVLLLCSTELSLYRRRQLLPSFSTPSRISFRMIRSICWMFSDVWRGPRAFIILDVLSAFTNSFVLFKHPRSWQSAFPVHISWCTSRFGCFFVQFHQESQVNAQLLS